MKKLFLVFPLLLLLGCIAEPKTDNQPVMPSDSIISEPQMVLLLADAHTIEAALLIARNKGTNTRDLAKYYYEGLFKKYRITKERYQFNLQHYREDPNGFIRLYDKVNLELKEREKNFIKPLPD